MPKRCVTTRCNNTADPKKRISIRRNPSTRKTQYLKKEGKWLQILSWLKEAR